MIKYIVKRLLQSILTILLVVSVVFILIRLMPKENFFTDDEQIKLNEVQKNERLASKGLMERCRVCDGAGWVFTFTPEGRELVKSLDPESEIQPYNLTPENVAALKQLREDANGELSELPNGSGAALKKLYTRDPSLLTARSCPHCTDDVTLATQREAGEDAYQKPGTGYVDRSVFAQLGDFYLDMFQLRVYQQKEQRINDDPILVSEQPDHKLKWDDIITVRIGETNIQLSSAKKKKNLNEDGTAWVVERNLGGTVCTITIPVDEEAECLASEVVQGGIDPADIQLITAHTEYYTVEKPDTTPVSAIAALFTPGDPFEGRIDRENGEFTRVVFNLGKSLREQKGVDVTKVIGDKMGISMRIGLIALAFSLILGVTFGVMQAQFKDRLFDHIGTGYTVLVNAVPHLVIYTLIMVLGSQLLDVPMQYDANAEPGSAWRSLVLPVICLSIGSIAGYMLWTRRYMVDELNKDYIRLARLKGLSSGKVMFRHVLKNAFVPLAQYLPYSILLTVGGSLLVEKFFGIPGMGPMLTNSIAKLDLPLVQGIVMLYASLGVIGVFLGDLLMTVIDPRIKLTGKEGVR